MRGMNFILLSDRYLWSQESIHWINRSCKINLKNRELERSKKIENGKRNDYSKD